MKLRLLVTEQCERNCPGCCNNDWDLSALPVLEERDLDLLDISLVMLTGGEPMLVLNAIWDVFDMVKRNHPHTPVYLYTAYLPRANTMQVWRELDGMTITLHEQSDVDPFLEFNRRMLLEMSTFPSKSMRLNVFKGVELPAEFMRTGLTWNIKLGIEWIENCPLPDDEIFMKGRGVL